MGSFGLLMPLKKLSKHFQMYIVAHLKKSKFFIFCHFLSLIARLARNLFLAFYSSLRVTHMKSWGFMSMCTNASNIVKKYSQD